MSRRKLMFLLLANHGLFACFATYVLRQDPYTEPWQQPLMALTFLAMAMSLAGLWATYSFANQVEDPMQPTNPLRVIWMVTAVSYLALWGVNSRQYYYPGGDVDPVAYLQKKTGYLGGYHLLEETGGYHLMADTDTYRVLISQGPYVELPYPLARYTVLSHIPSIIEIKEHKVSMNLPHTKRGNECTLSLVGAVVHIPFNEERVGKILKHLGDRWVWKPEFEITQQLEKVFEPIFKSVTEPLPEGTIYIDLDVTDGILGPLEEHYGFRIVALPNNTATLKCIIKYVGDPPVNDQIQLLRGQEVRMSQINELFPPRNNTE